MGNETIRARQGIYSEKFDYNAEQSANHCNELILIRNALYCIRTKKLIL